MIILLSLLTALLLLGCTPETPAPESPPTAAQTLLPEAHTQEAPLSLATFPEEGLQIFSLPEKDCTGIRTLGNTLVVFSGCESTTLTAFQGETLLPAGQLRLEFALNARDPSLQLWDRAFSFYDPQRRQIRFLGENLEEQRSISIPEGVTGTPLLSSRQDVLYYTTDAAIFAWDLEENLHRRLKETPGQAMTLTGLYLNDSVLCLSLQERAGNRSLFLSTRDGRILEESAGEIRLQSQVQGISLSLPWGMDQRQLVFREDALRFFLPRNRGSQVFFPENRDAAVTIHAPEPGSLVMEHYDLIQGRRTAAVELSAKETPLSLADTPDAIYALLPGGDAGAALLCRWEDSFCSVSDERCYTAPYLSCPKESDLASCRDYAGRLSQTFGIPVSIAPQIAGQSLIPEDQPGLLMEALEQLEDGLSRLPAPILQETAGHFSAMKLGLLREIPGQYAPLRQNPGSEALLLITAGNSLADSLYRSLFLAMETRILTHSSAFDQWEEENPAHFRYSYASTAPQDPSLLTGNSRCFSHAQGMTFPREDRAGIFALAMAPGQRQAFSAPGMQGKLRRICQGIRDAYSLSGVAENLPWEQYLENPIR